MAVLLMDGFDCYDSAADLQLNSLWPTVAGFSTSAGRFGGGALVIPGNVAVMNANHVRAFATNTTYYVSFSLKVGAVPAAANRGILALTLADTTTRLTGLSLTPTGALTIVNNANTLIAGATAGIIAAGNWYRVELKFNFGTTTSNGTAELRVYGTAVHTVTGQAFFRAGGSALLSFRNDVVELADAWIDDLVILDTAGSQNNNFLGDMRIDAVRPSADTVTASWTPNSGSTGYTQIDDPLGASDGDSTYIQSTTAAQKSEFEMTSLPGSSITIAAVQTRLKTRRSNAGPRTYRSYINSGGTPSNGVTLPSQAAYTWDYNGVFEVDPNTSTAWTDAGVNALNMGVEMVS